MAAARSHKAIFCEKPVAARTEDAIAAAKEAEHAGVPNFVGFMKRFDPGFQSLLEAVRDGVIGSVELSLITNRDPKVTILDLLRSTHETAPYALLRESTVHDFDLQLAILGPDIREVYAAGSALVSPQIAALDEIDTAMVTLRSASGALGHINNSWRAVYGYDQRIEVMGSEGMLESRNRPVTTNVLYSSSGAHQEPLFSGPTGPTTFSCSSMSRHIRTSSTTSSRAWRLARVCHPVLPTASALNYWSKRLSSLLWRNARRCYKREPPKYPCWRHTDVYAWTPLVSRRGSILCRTRRSK